MFIHLLFTDDTICEPCNKPDTFEGILDNFCSSEFGKFMHFYKAYDSVKNADISWQIKFDRFNRYQSAIYKYVQISYSVHSSWVEITHLKPYAL